MAADYSPPRDEAELDALTRLVLSSFGDFTPFEQHMHRVGHENLRLLREDGRPVAGHTRYPMGQWFGGRRLSMTGIAVVSVPPELRRQGVARRIMRAALEELELEGVALSVLYASTSRLYRALGYERAGTYTEYAQPVGSLGMSDRDLPVQEVPCQPGEPFVSLKTAQARSGAGHGNLDRSQATWGRLLERGPTWAYTVGEPERPRGYVVLQRLPGTGGHLDLLVKDFVALDAEAGRRLWTLLGDHETVGGDVRWFGPPCDPLLDLLPEQNANVRRQESWLLRLVRAPHALEERGYPASVSGQLDLELEDPILPANSGRWRLTVSAGRGQVEPGGEGSLRTSINGLAPLFSGHRSASQLRQLGLLEAADAALEVAERLFAGPQPWLADFF